MKRNTNTRSITLGAIATAALSCLALGASDAQAYPLYNNGGTGCVECHAGFQGGPQGGLHAQHVSLFGITASQQCNLCHPSFGGSAPVRTYTSGAGYGCAGCHGQDYGETSPNSGQPKATGYGLRQAHANAGVMICGGCHMPGVLGHQDPAPAILGENVAPPYYNTPATNLRNPCDSNQEDLPFDMDLVGLDNDGDGLRDYPADPDCPPTTTTTTTTSTTTTTLPVACGPAPAGGCIAAGSGSLKVSEKKAGKESVKASFKNLVSAVTQAQFGDPVDDGTSYALCIYTAGNALAGELSVARAGEVCEGKACWSKVSTKGYKYGDKAASADGVSKISLGGGDAGKGKISMSAKNNAAKGQNSLPTGIATALSGSASATVQLLTSDASCFEATLTDVKDADGTVFSAVGP
jgi:hypothetical protein